MEPRTESTRAESRCDTCINYIFDEYLNEYVCDVAMDEDETYRLNMHGPRTCPYYIDGDEYRTVRKQI